MLALGLALSLGQSPNPKEPSPSPPSLQGERAWLSEHATDPDFSARLYRLACGTESQGDFNGLIKDFFSTIPTAEGRRALASLAAARYELIGDYSQAAKFYEAAGETQSILRAALCHLRSGETDEAQAALRPLAAKAGPESLRARLILACVTAASGDRGAALAELEGLYAESGDQKSQVLYAAWLCAPIGKRDAYAARLSKECPGSAEALVCAQLGQVKPELGAFTYLSGLLDVQGFSEAEDQGLSPNPSPASLAKSSPAIKPTEGSRAQPESSRAPSLSEKAIKYYQLGIFSKRENAEKLLNDGRLKGLRALIRARRRDDGQSLYAVLVPVGEDAQGILGLLKDRGFETYPVFE